MIEIEILLTFVYFLECTVVVVQCKARPWMLANLKIICQFHANSVHQNSVEIFWAEIYQGRLLTLITGSSSRLLRIQFSADLTMYWFPVCHFRCMKFKPLVIWIWNQNIAISTLVGTSFHNMTLLHHDSYPISLSSYGFGKWSAESDSSHKY
jgi:hypothetical protein